MRAVMLAAGIGRRLGASHHGVPKILLDFAGRTLLERHLAILEHVGIEELTLATGYRAADVERAVAMLAPSLAVDTVYNPNFGEGSIVSLFCVREALCAEEGVVLMDGDVLYDHRLMARLLDAPHTNCLPIDREIEADDEAVKVCLREGTVVDFDKQPRAAHDDHGEWVGFLKLATEGAHRLSRAAGRIIEQGARDAPAEDAIRDTVLEAPGAFGIVDVAGLPWIEIDFPEDITHARDRILPRLEDLPR